MKKTYTKQILAYMLSFAILLASCSSPENETLIDSNGMVLKNGEVIDKYTGEEIFRALYFLQGELVNELPTSLALKESIAYIKLSRDEEKEINKFYDGLIADIKKADPNYFIDFKSKLEKNSDDLYELETIYSDGLEMVRTTGMKGDFKKIFELNQEFLDKGVDFNREDLKNLDLSKEDDYKKFVDILGDDYGINIEDEYLQQTLACNFGIFCVVAIAVAVTQVVAAQSVVGLWVYAVYAKVKLWPKDTKLTKDLTRSKQIAALEISNLFE